MGYLWLLMANHLQKATLGALGFCTFYFFTCFSTLFFALLKFLDLYQNRKINPVRRILGKSIQDCFCVFFCFCSGFLLSQAQLSKNSRKTKKNKKTNPVRRILGKSIQDCFFLFFLVYLVFLEVFAVPSPTVQKLEENQKKQKKQSCLDLLSCKIKCTHVQSNTFWKIERFFWGPVIRALFLGDMFF